MCPGERGQRAPEEDESRDHGRNASGEIGSVAPGPDSRIVRNGERKGERLAGARRNGAKPVRLRGPELDGRTEDAVAVRADVRDGPPASAPPVAKLNGDASLAARRVATPHADARPAQVRNKRKPERREHRLRSRVLE